MSARRAARHALVLGVLALVCGALARAGTVAADGGLWRRVGALPALPLLESAALGYRSAAADLAWLQAVQYYGEFRQGGNDLSEFRHFVAAVNALDPRFEHAYVFGATVLATDGGDLAAALEVLRRGARANPESASFPFEMGFLTYVAGGDPRAALGYFTLAARHPQGRDRARRFAAYINRRMGRLETAWLLWQDIYRTTTDASMRQVAVHALRKLEAEIGRQP